MLDDKDIKKLSEVFLTKEVFLEIGATKDDIKNFATKDDVTKFKNDILKGQDEILEKLDIL